MSNFWTKTHLIVAFAAVAMGASCGTPRRTHLAQPPAPVPEFVTPDPPALESHIPIGNPGQPIALPTQSTQHREQAADVVSEAEYHFQLGRKQYVNGNTEAARAEFDRAIDLLLAAPEPPISGLRGPVERKLEELTDAIYRLDLAGLGSADTQEPGYDQSPRDEIPEMTFRVDPKLKDQVLEEVRATASQLPLEVNDAVLSYIDYFSSERGRRLLLAGLRRAGRYKPMILRILDEEGIPQELIYLAQLESGFLPRAKSRKQATGMWQFMAARGKQYGLERTAYVDERLDFEESTRAAAKHLHDLYRRYGDWYLAMAAYNAGPGVIDRAVERTGYADFWKFCELKVLPRDTMNYVPVILAMTIMMKNARRHGLENIETDPPIEYDTVQLDAPASIQLLADIADAPVSEIRELNPALLKNISPAGTLRVPKGTAPRYAVLDSIPLAKRLCWRAHRVTRTDTLASIARAFRIPEAAISAVNSGALDPGDLLLIPVPEQRGAVRSLAHRHTRKVASRRRPAARRSASSQRPARTAAAARASSEKPPAGAAVTYSAENRTSRSNTVRR